MLPPLGDWKRVMEQGVVVRVGVGDAYVVIASEGAGYAPDMVHDMTARALEGLQGSLITAIETGYIPIDEEYEELTPDGVEIADDDEEVTGGSEIWWIQ